MTVMAIISENSGSFKGCQHPPYQSSTLIDPVPLVNQNGPPNSLLDPPTHTLWKKAVIQMNLLDFNPTSPTQTPFCQNLDPRLLMYKGCDELFSESVNCLKLYAGLW